MPAVEPPLRYGIVISDLKDRVGADVADAVLDDNNDGQVDKGPAYRLLADAISFVEGAAGNHYSLNAMRAVNPAPNELQRLILDAAEWMAVKRHPEVQRGHSWKDLRDANREDIVDWAKGQRRLDTDGAPEPSKTQGGTTVTDIGQGPPNPTPPKFFDDMADY